MQRGIIVLLLVALAATWVCATFAGTTQARTRYFTAIHVNAEYVDAEAVRCPTLAQTAREVAMHWRLFLQAYRAVVGDAALARRLAARKPTLETREATIDDTAQMRALLAGAGITARMLDAQPTHVYTLQLAAFAERDALTRFLGRTRAPNDGLDIYEGTGIYHGTTKSLPFYYGADLWYKEDPTYIEAAGRFTRVRYGIYENTADAEADGAIWQQRFGVTPLVVRVLLTEHLVQRVLWGRLPGVWEPE